MDDTDEEGFTRYEGETDRKEESRSTVFDREDTPLTVGAKLLSLEALGDVVEEAHEDRLPLSYRPK